MVVLGQVLGRIGRVQFSYQKKPGEGPGVEHDVDEAGRHRPCVYTPAQARTTKKDGGVQAWGCEPQAKE